MTDLLAASGITDIWINRPDSILYRLANGEVHQAEEGFEDDEQVKALVDRWVRPLDRRLDLSQPFVDARLPGRPRVHAIMPPLTRRYTTVNLVRTIEAVLGLQPMGLTDALAELPDSDRRFYVETVCVRLGRPNDLASFFRAYEARPELFHLLASRRRFPPRSSTTRTNLMLYSVARRVTIRRIRGHRCRC